MSKLSQHNQYIQEKLAQGQMVQLIAESRRNGDSVWVTRGQLHADEDMREMMIQKSLPTSDNLLIVALNPTTGLFGVFELAKPCPELNFDAGGCQAADPLIVAKEAADIVAARVHRTGTFTGNVIRDICAGTIKHFEDLSAKTPPDVDVSTVLSMLAQARKPSITLDIVSKGQITIGGVENMKKALPCRTTYKVRADVREIDEDGKPNGTLSFKIQEVKSAAADVPDILNKNSRIGASLKTGADAKALALLHFAKVHETTVNLELQLEYQFAEHRWDVKVVEILDEQELLAKDRRAQMVFSGW